MNREQTLNALRRIFDKSTFRILYLRHKNYIPPVLAIIGSIAIFLIVIMPQIQNFLSLGDQEKSKKETITNLKNNFSFLSSLNDSDLDSKLQVVSVALPPEKDFAGIMQSIAAASTVAGVAVGDFAFQPGQLSSVEPQAAPLAAGQPTPAVSRPTIEVALNITGGVEGSKRFIEEIAKNLPLSEIRRVEINEKSSLITIAFYYKVLPLIKLNERSPLSPLSQKEESLIQDLSSRQASLGVPAFSF